MKDPREVKQREQGPPRQTGGEQQVCCQRPAGSTRHSGLAECGQRRAGSRARGATTTGVTRDEDRARSFTRSSCGGPRWGYHRRWGEGRKITVPSWMRARKGGPTLATEDLQQHAPIDGTAGGGQGVSESRHAPSTEDGAAGGRSDTSKSRDVGTH